MELSSLSNDDLIRLYHQKDNEVAFNNNMQMAMKILLNLGQQVEMPREKPCELLEVFDMIANHVPNIKGNQQPDIWFRDYRKHTIKWK